MKALTSFLQSTIGRKVVMSVTGLLLVIFLVGHLIGNLLILKSAESFNEYAHGLVSMTPWIWIAEIGLLVLFVVHMVQAIILNRVNNAARPQKYYGFGLAGGTSRKTPMSSNMIRTGLLVALFLVLHLKGFKWGEYYEWEGHPGMRDLHRLVIEAYSQTTTVALYVFFMLVLGAHLVHGVHSAFQTLGIPHRRICMRASQGLAVILAAGFGLIPLIVYFMGDKLA